MSKVAREYARAIFFALEKEEDRKAMLKLLNEVRVSFLETPSFFQYYKAGAITVDNVKNIFDVLLQKTMPNHQTVKNFMHLIVDKRRVIDIPQIADEYQFVMDEENDIARGLIRSANKPTPQKIKELEEHIGKKINKRVFLTHKEDHRAMAGLRVEVEPYTFDDTFETHIKNIKEKLNRSWN